MAKIGRNDPCPCGSGQKYKRCCLDKQEANAETQVPRQKVTVKEEVAILQKAAVNKEETLKIIGVFIFLSTAGGDAWLLELTEQDALLVAKGGKKIKTEITENGETIEVNWSHSFKIINNNFVTTAYADKAVETYDGYPAATIKAAHRKIERNFSSQLLDSIHVDS
ncbi:MAG: hypothetical protein GXP59_05450 [Deltaproteobacteria bacterium]|nr:hypothetical protein [Deltaproteobacteria bacterium]